MNTALENEDSSKNVLEVKTKKPKKPATPAQKEAITKALTALKLKREALKKQNEEEVAIADESQKQTLLKERYEKAKTQKKKLPPAPSYVTTADLDRFKNEIIGALPKEVYKAVEVPVVEKPIPKQVTFEKPIEPPTEMVKPVVKSLTGHELLDKLFFNK